MATFTCDHCGHSQGVSDEHAGKMARCPQCKERGPVSVDSVPELDVVPPQFNQMIVDTPYDRDPIIRRSAGGSIQTSLGHGIVLNKNSSLMREWITIADPNFPVELVSDTGISTKYQAGTQYSAGKYVYSAEYAIKCCEPIQAFQVRFLTFDLWGSHDRTLAATEIQDIVQGVTHKFTAEWNLFSENEACEFYASIAYVGQIRTRSGRVLKADPSTAIAEAKRFSEKFSESDLEPTKKP